MPKLTLKYRDGKYSDHYLVREGGGYYARVASSNKKQGKSGLLEIIRQSIAKKGYYDPDESSDRSDDDVS